MSSVACPGAPCRPTCRLPAHRGVVVAVERRGAGENAGADGRRRELVAGVQHDASARGRNAAADGQLVRERDRDVAVLGVEPVRVAGGRDGRAAAEQSADDAEANGGGADDRGDLLHGGNPICVVWPVGRGGWLAHPCAPEQAAHGCASLF